MLDYIGDEIRIFQSRAVLCFLLLSDMNSPRLASAQKSTIQHIAKLYVVCLSFISNFIACNISFVAVAVAGVTLRPSSSASLLIDFIVIGIGSVEDTETTQYKQRNTTDRSTGIDPNGEGYMGW